MSDAASIPGRIKELKALRNAVILAHNYQLPEVQEIADYVGDSLELSRRAAATAAGVIVFCGVHFMAETASILCPDKTVLLPDLESGCPMADMMDAQQLRELKGKYPDAAVVCYVNSSAEVKAECDLCCTSANACDVVRSIGSDRRIIFVPDKYLGSYVAEQTKRELILWPGYCPTHALITPQHVEKAKAQHPGAAVMVHPECIPAVTHMADAVLSTSGMCRFARETKAREIIVGTEVGLLYRLKKENPDKVFIPVTEAALCPNMKLNTVEKVLWALEELKHEVRVPPDIRRRARRALDAMVATRPQAARLPAAATHDPGQ